MDRQQWAAKKIHEITNLAFWLGNEGFRPDHPPTRLARSALKATGINPYEILRNLLFNKEVIAVNGESVVVTNTSNTVDKHMFRRPHTTPLEQFRNDVEREITTVLHHLSGIALATTVTIKATHCFRPHPLRGVPAVTQTQQKLNLEQHKTLELLDIQQGNASDMLVRNLELLLAGSRSLINNEGLLPDILGNSGNLRLSPDEELTLIDVMPLYSGGGRLIGDGVSSSLPEIERRLAHIEDIIGAYG
ncbi:MAG: hypothetical protein Q4A34_03500 [Candidatus Saccharibacteria bacterium]|nr:hypothetical protein [Candidatus Saccharibacteria bacterium]